MLFGCNASNDGNGNPPETGGQMGRDGTSTYRRTFFLILLSVFLIEREGGKHS